MNDRISKIISNFIYFCSGIILIYLLTISIFSTSVTGIDLNGESQVFYKRDFPIVHIISIGVLMLAIRIAKKKITNIGICKKYTLAIIFSWGIAAFLWALLYTEQPQHDPANVLLAAKQMRQYNFSSFVGEGYLNMWTGNQSLALIFYLLSFLFGIDNFIMLRILNVAAAIGSIYALYKTALTIWKCEEKAVLFIIGGCGIYIPYFLYTTFVYGDIYGTSLAIMAVCAELKYFKEQKYRWIFLSAVLIGISILLKMNCLIILIAMIGALVYNMILNKSLKRELLGILMIILIAAGIQSGSKEILHRITGLEGGEGVPVTAWIAMGLQDEGNAPGHYNGYNRQVFVDNGYDSQKTKEQTRSDIEKALGQLKSEPQYALDFFVRKTAAQWGMPDCGALSNGNKQNDSLAWIIKSVQTGKIGSSLKVFLNLYQTWILFGAICYIWLKSEKTDYEWIFLLIFIGGFTFHLFWEAGSRYAFPYYFMLTPYGAMGLVQFQSKAEEVIGNRSSSKSCLRQLRTSAVVIAVIALLGFVPAKGILGNFPLEAENKAKPETAVAEDGYYTIAASADDSLYLTEENGNVILKGNDTDTQIVSIFQMYANKIIRFMPSQKTLELAGGNEICSKILKNSFEWRLKNIEDGKYYILMDDETALSYNLSDWSVQLTDFKEGDESQIWKIVKRRKDG